MSALCIVTGCRIPGRHQSACSDGDCGGCLPRATDGAYACEPCTDRVRRALLGDDRHDDRPGLVDTAPAARDIAHGFSARGDGGGSGKPESRMPLDLSVTARLDAVQGEMTTWARHVAEERSGRWMAHAGGDPIVHAARYLAANLDWLAHRPEAGEAYAAIHACARVVRGIVRGPSEQRYLGPCGATWDIGTLESPEQKLACDGDVYGYVGAEKGRCKTCKTEVSQDERRIWLEDKARSSDLAWTARGIADALSINPKTLRAWADERRAPNGVVLRRAKLATFWRNPDGQLIPWVEPPVHLFEVERRAQIRARGDRLHYVADVVELARETAARRAEAGAAREQEDASVAD